MTGGGNLSITTCTFSVNTAVGNTGGAIDFEPQGATGTLTIDRTAPTWLGAYMGFAIPSAGQGLVTYADNTDGKAHVLFGKIALP